MSLLGRVKKAAQAFNKDDDLTDKEVFLTPGERKGEEAMLAVIMSEMESGQKRQGVWAKALMHSNGDEKKAESLYIKYAVQSLVDDHVIQNIKKEEDRIAREVRMEKDRIAQEEKQDNMNFVVVLVIIIIVLFINSLR
jgi:hypothetical protein